MVGRDVELGFLRDRLAAARAGAGQVVLVCGAAGIGKTRLAEELAASAGVQVGWGGALGDAGMPPPWAWAPAVRHLPAPSAPVAPIAARALPRRYGSGEDAAAAVFAADTQVVDALAEQAQPGRALLLVLDDLQWADGATLRLLGRVAREVRRLPLLIVGTQRDPGGGSRQGSPAQGLSDVLNLRPLTPTESAALLSRAVGSADPEAVRRAAERSGGSPVYLKTMNRAAAQQLRGREPWTETGGESPELGHLVAAAMRSAGPDTARAVQALSVLGAEADLALLAQLLGLDSPTAAFELLLPAVPAGLIEGLPASAKRASFAHS